jgi:transposase InsO family protein
LVKHEYVNGRKVYIFVAKDVKTKISFTFAYDRLNNNAKDFLEKSVDVMPSKIKGIQTDNGSEFLGEFTKALKKKDIKHYFSYPRYPKEQAYAERINRILQEEFMMYYKDYKLEDIYEFNKKILQFYNTFVIL